MQQLVFTSDGYALDWAKKHLDFDKSELVGEAPWARVFRLNGKSGGAYLRVLPPALSKSSLTLPFLTQRFPQHIPELISNDPDLGLVLLRHHGGRRLDKDVNNAELRDLLNTYASIQAEFSHQPDLAEHFPVVNLDSLLQELLQFLDPAASRKPVDGKVSSVYFIGRTKSRDYYGPLKGRAELMETQLSAAKQLPTTINHCDLRLKNAALAAGGTIVLTGWDDATVGPAGLSLHSLFDGCAAPTALLQGRPDKELGNVSRNRHMFEAYLEALIEGGYASREDLELGLPGAFCAGAIRQLLWYADFPSDNRRYRSRVRKILRSRLSDLLDYCDLIACRRQDTLLSAAADYRDNGRTWRAEKLLRQRLSSNPNDATTHGQLALTLHERGKHAEAMEAYREALDLNPISSQLLNGFGLALLEDLRFDEAISNLRKSLRMPNPPQETIANLERACELRNYAREADDPDTMPRIAVSALEREAGRLRPETVALGSMLFSRNGTLLIENAFDPDMIRACNEHFSSEYTEYFNPDGRPDALPIGDKRFQVTISLAGAFNDARLYGNPFILDLMSSLLGKKFFLGCTVCATSLPGSKDQHLHKDHRALFTRNADDPPIELPPFAITTMIPLVNLDENTGTTTVKKGSHLLSRRESKDLPTQTPIVPVGSCFLMDMRLSHAGLGNKTKNVRPILNFVYQQPWFADNKNFRKQPPVHVPKSEYRKVPRDLRRLFDWTRQPGPIS